MTIISANFVVWKISNEFQSRYFDIWIVPNSLAHSVLQDLAPKIEFGEWELFRCRYDAVFTSGARFSIFAGRHSLRVVGKGFFLSVYMFFKSY